MKRLLSFIISCAMFLTGCSTEKNVESEISVENHTEISYQEESKTEPETIVENITEVETITETQTIPKTETEIQEDFTEIIDTNSEEYIESLGFTSLKDDEFINYIEDTVYADLVNRLNSDDYFVENVEAVYISKEYLEESAYNSQENIYFGYKLSELDEAFQGQEYIFTLGENGQTDVVPFEEYDGTFETVARNVAIGTGVILLCVTVSAVTGGLGTPAVSMIFAASAKSATVLALSSGVIDGVSAGIIEGMETHNFDKAIKAAALKGSEEFMCGAIFGAITGGASETIALKGATLNGLTMSEAALIQRESKYPLDVIKQFNNIEQYDICKDIGLTAEMVSGKTALVRNIDLNFVNETNGMTNLQLMQQGNAAIDPISGLPYELHHIGQKADSTLAILTKTEHMQNGNNKIWHKLGGESEIDGAAFDKVRQAFWKSFAEMVS